MCASHCKHFKLIDRKIPANAMNIILSVTSGRITGCFISEVLSAAFIVCQFQPHLTSYCLKMNALNVKFLSSAPYLLVIDPNKALNDTKVQ